MRKGKGAGDVCETPGMPSELPGQRERERGEEKLARALPMTAINSKKTKKLNVVAKKT